MNKDIPDSSKNSHRKFRLIDMLFLILIIGAITSIVGIYLTEKEGKMTYEQKQLLQNSTPERSKKRHREYSTSVGNYQYRGIVDMSLTESEYTYHFKRVWVDEQLADFEKLMNDVLIIPTKKDDKSYFMFQYIREESIYEQLGLKPNDIILEINGFLVDTVENALKLLELLQSGREIVLMVEREGKPIKFFYYIN